MSLLDTLIGLIAPHECLACGSEGQLLCEQCLNCLSAVPDRCYRCRKVSSTFLTCRACRQTSRLHRVYVSTVYDGWAKDLIWQLKFNGAQAAASIMARHLSKLLPSEASGYTIVPVPTATGRARQRGYDQAKLIARDLARRTGLSYHDCLARSGQGYQHGLPRQARLAQLATAFRVKRPDSIHGRHIILVDDVITTGATLEAAATVVKNSGADLVEAMAFAQP